MRDAVQPPIRCDSEQQHEDMDPLPCPEDDEFFVSPDAASMEEAIGKFMEGLERQESGCFPNINRLIQSLPVPAQKVNRCMTHSEALEGQFLPNMSEEEQKRFTPSELLLYKHALEYKWTAEQLKKVIAMVKRPDFDSNEIDPDLHKRMENAVLDGRIKCFNMREGPADGDQDLNAWFRELEDVVREIMEDPVFKGNQKYSFEMDLDEAGKRLYGGEANAGLAFQIGQLRYILFYTLLYQYKLVYTMPVLNRYKYILVYTSIY
jgi:hypothetical protein